MRVLLQGPDCRVWYLGERVRGWQSGGRSRRVPVALPRGMFHGHSLQGDALGAARGGVDADELRDRSKRRYQEFARAHLLQRVGPNASSSRAPTGGPSQVFQCSIALVPFSLHRLVSFLTCYFGF